MKKRKMKKAVIYGIYSLGVIAFVGTIYLIESNVQKQELKEQPTTYVSKSLFDDTINVVANENKIVKPYTDESVKILQNYYDSKGEETDQQKSIIYYENTYMPSSGVSYGGKEDFDVVSVYDGTVISVKKDNTTGNTIEIKHSDDIISVYQSLSDVTVKENDTVTKGQIIGTSGTSNIQKDLGKHLYFEMLVKGVAVNPENYYGKSLSEL